MTFNPAPPPATSREGPGCAAYGLFALAILWICFVLGVSAPAEWAARDVLMILGLDWPWWASPLVALIQAGLIAAPVGLLGALTRGAPRLRAAYLTWAAACAMLAAYGLVRGLPGGWSQAAWLLQALVGLAAALALWLIGPGRPRPTTRAGLLLGLLPAPLAALPWLIFGALGSPADTLLALLAGAALGLAVGLLLDRLLLPALAASPAGAGADVGLGGLTIGAALLIVAAGAGFQASNLLLMAALPPLGVAAAALARAAAPGRWSWAAPAALVGAVAGAAMALFDPDEVTLVLGAHEIPEQALAATGWALLAGLALSAGLWAAHNRLGPLRARPVALGGLGAAALVAGLAYALAGRPGFYGERLFVIMREQADLSGAAAIGDREARLRYVYETTTELAQRSQAELRAELARFGVRATPYYLVNALEVDGGPLVRLYLSGRPEVARVLESPRLRPLPAPPPPEPGAEAAPARPEWNITSIGAARVWEELGITGEGIVIGQSDSGVDGQHPALRDSYRGRDEGDAYNWLDPWYGAPSPRDYGMHGTHTLGSAVGAGGIGVAPGARWFACSNLARNLGNPAHYLDCMQFMLAPYAPGADPLTDGDPARAAHVLNNSWGCPPIEGCDPTSLQPAVEALRAAGIFVVASAGNEGDRCESVSDPIAIYDAVLSVGAVDERGNVTDFSSRGPVSVDGSGRTKPDLLAPGDEILSAAPGGAYARASGTSMAGPHVAGVVALVWSANPALIGDIETTERILIETARPYRGEGGLSCAGDGEASNVYGHGLVDAYAAVLAALELR